MGNDWLDDFIEGVGEEKKAEIGTLMYIDRLLESFTGSIEEAENIFAESQNYTEIEAKKIINYLKENQCINNPVDRFKYFINHHYPKE